MKQLNEFTVNKLDKMMHLKRKGVHQSHISKKLGISEGMVSRIFRAQMGINKDFEKLGSHVQEVILEYNNNKLQAYTCSLFWGLIRLKFTPLIDEQNQ